jgi:hypothetical protein
MKKYGFLSSSVNPQALSLTITSGVRLIGTLLSAVLVLQGIDYKIENEVIDQVASSLVMIVTAVFSFIEGARFLYGLGRKIMVAMSARLTDR